MAFLTYNVTNEQSFESLNYWLNKLNDKVEIDNIILLLADDKIDVEVSKILYLFLREKLSLKNIIRFLMKFQLKLVLKNYFKLLQSKNFSINES